MCLLLFLVSLSIPRVKISPLTLFLTLIWATVFMPWWRNGTHFSVVQCVYRLYMVWDAFQCHVMNQLVAECRNLHWIALYNCCRPGQGKHLISCVADRLTVPFPGDILRFGVSPAAAHQLCLLQAHKPFCCSRVDGCIWWIWHRENHTVTLNVHQYTARKLSKFHPKPKKVAVQKIY